MTAMLFGKSRRSSSSGKPSPHRSADYSNPPFAKWYAGGKTNLCHNAVDRHLAERADQAALVYVSTETNTEKTYSFRQLHTEVQCMAAILKDMGVGKGDRVLIYMPMVAQAAFAMLACARIGAIHSVVFGGFASVSLAQRIDDATPKVIITADAGSRGGKAVPYTALLEEAIKLAAHKPGAVLMVNRQLAAIELHSAPVTDYASARTKHLNTPVPCEWLDATDVSYILYTSGTTGKPKGVQRDVGGYGVGLAASMKYIFNAKAGEVFFATSDIGWVVGHSYIVYGPLLAGLTTVFFEGTPVRAMDGSPDGGIWWSLVEKYKVNHMFSAPTAIRVLKKQDPAYLDQIRPQQPQSPVPGGRAGGRTHGALDQRRYWQTRGGQLLANRNGLADFGHRQWWRFARPRAAVWQPRRAHVRLQRQALARKHGRGNAQPRRKRRGGGGRPAAPRLHANRVGRRCPLCQNLLESRARQAGVQHL